MRLKLPPTSRAFQLLEYLDKIPIGNDNSFNAVMQTFCMVCVGIVPHEISRHSNDLKST